MAIRLGWDEGEVRIPAGLRDLKTFHRWLSSADLPRSMWVGFIQGECLFGYREKQDSLHGRAQRQVEQMLAEALADGPPGHLLTCGIRVRNAGACLSIPSDGAFVSDESIELGRARLLVGENGASVEVEGSPDMILEVVSRHSSQKDTVRLRELYWKAGIPEYWLLDIRGDFRALHILRWTATGYVPTRRYWGWLKSTVFGRSFRLLRRNDEDGNPELSLEVR